MSCVVKAVFATFELNSAVQHESIVRVDSESRDPFSSIRTDFHVHAVPRNAAGIISAAMTRSALSPALRPL